MSASTLPHGHRWDGFHLARAVREHNGPRELEFLLVAVPCAFAALGFETFVRVAVTSDPVLLVTVGFGAGTIPGAPVWAGAACVPQVGPGTELLRARVAPGLVRGRSQRSGGATRAGVRHEEATDSRHCGGLQCSWSQGLFLSNIQELLWQRTWAMSPSSLRGCKSRKEVFEITIHSCLYCYFIP